MQSIHIEKNLSGQAEIAIVGAGPIGLELAVSLKRAGINALHFDAQQIGYTISWWPRNTYFFSTTERIEIAGVPIQNNDQGRITGEAYLAYLRAIVEQFDLQIHTYEPVVDIQPTNGGFYLFTQPLTGERIYHARYVVLANGGMDAPRKLNIPGEDLPHVTHYFTDPHVYFRKRLLIVGGRNSAVEAALRCWRAGSQVALSYRGEKLDARVVKNHILPDLETQIRNGTIAFFPQTRAASITPDHVVLENLVTGDQIQHPTDFVYLATGFVADTRLFEAAGVKLEGVQRAPVFDPNTMETNIPGIYVAGTSAAGTQSRYRLFIENTHVHVGKIMQAITGRWPEKLGTVAGRRYDQPLEDIQAN
jgi:thioredoxin reductase (NADPH)